MPASRKPPPPERRSLLALAVTQSRRVEAVAVALPAPLSFPAPGTGAGRGVAPQANQEGGVKFDNAPSHCQSAHLVHGTAAAPPSASTSACAAWRVWQEAFRGHERPSGSRPTPRMRRARMGPRPPMPIGRRQQSCSRAHRPLLTMLQRCVASGGRAVRLRSRDSACDRARVTPPGGWGTPPQPRGGLGRGGRDCWPRRPGKEGACGWLWVGCVCVGAPPAPRMQSGAPGLCGQTLPLQWCAAQNRGGNQAQAVQALVHTPRSTTAGPPVFE